MRGGGGGLQCFVCEQYIQPITLVFRTFIHNLRLNIITVHKSLPTINRIQFRGPVVIWSLQAAVVNNL